MAIAVRRIQPAEWALLRRVRLAALAESPSAFGSTHEDEAEQPEEFWEQRARRGAEGVDRVTFFAVNGDGVVGLAGGFVSEDPRAAELVSIWTEPATRRTGAARALASAVIDWARGLGSDRLYLWVTKGNEPALRLYASLGFVETGEYQPLPSDPRKDEIRMRRPLRQP